jgi:uncharacterized protein (DUF1330 family)
VKIMAYQMLVGLFVSDQDTYAQYRSEIAPLLEAAGGKFRYDFEVARTLRSEQGEDVNRVFVLQFPDRMHKERFFADPQYQSIRARLFVPAVKGGGPLAEWDNRIDS